MSYSEGDKEQYKRQCVAMLDHSKMPYGRLYFGIIDTTKKDI
jgi:hypothetical protein